MRLSRHVVDFGGKSPFQQASVWKRRDSIMLSYDRNFPLNIASKLSGFRMKFLMYNAALGAMIDMLLT